MDVHCRQGKQWALHGPVPLEEHAAIGLCGNSGTGLDVCDRMRL
jgi:hypothetical protein